MIVKFLNRLGQVKCVRQGVESVDKISTSSYNIKFESDKDDEKIKDVKNIEIVQETKTVVNKDD